MHCEEGQDKCNMHEISSPFSHFSSGMKGMRHGHFDCNIRDRMCRPPVVRRSWLQLRRGRRRLPCDQSGCAPFDLGRRRRQETGPDRRWRRGARYSSGSGSRAILAPTVETGSGRYTTTALASPATTMGGTGGAGSAGKNVDIITAASNGQIPTEQPVGVHQERGFLGRAIGSLLGVEQPATPAAEDKTAVTADRPPSRNGARSTRPNW